MGYVHEYSLEPCLYWMEPYEIDIFMGQKWSNTDNFKCFNLIVAKIGHDLAGINSELIAVGSIWMSSFTGGARALPLSPRHIKDLLCFKGMIIVLRVHFKKNLYF